MGQISSACENCFNAKDDPVAKKHIAQRDTRDTQEGKPETEADVVPVKNAPETVRNYQTYNSFNPATIQSMGRSRSRTGGNLSELKKKKHEDPADNGKVSITDFTLIKVLGKGSFGKVYFVQKNANKKFYAIKTLKKHRVVASRQADMAMNEKNILQNASHPFVVKLHYAFQDPKTLYFVMDFCAGGELYSHLQRNGPLNQEMTLFYAAEVVMGLRYLHEKLDIIYRDLKPENILVDAKGHLKLADFGLSTTTKQGMSVCGTPEYLAPEILLEQGYGKMVDWWSLGILIFEMATGYRPFSNKNRDKLFEDIKETAPMIPNHFSKNMKDLITKLLEKDPTKRLGYNGADEIQKHPAFQNIKWDEDTMIKKTPPFIPLLTKPNDLRYFDKTFLKETPAETPQPNSKVFDNPDYGFSDFSYIPKDLGTVGLMEEAKRLKI